MQDNIPLFVASWSSQLISTANQVRNLIGAKHWLSDGRHKENLLRTFIIDHIPKVCDAGTGFILPLGSPDQVSREIDILITDKRSCSVIFNSGDLVIVPPNGVLAHVHVKSTLTKSSFQDALATSISASNALSFSDGEGVATAALFFFETTLEGKDPVKISRFFEDIKPDLAKLINAKSVSSFFVAAGTDFFAIAKKATDKRPAKLLIFNLESLAIGAFLANIVSSAETYLEKVSRRPDLIKLIISLSSAPLVTIEL